MSKQYKVLHHQGFYVGHALLSNTATPSDYGDDCEVFPQVVIKLQRDGYKCFQQSWIPGYVSRKESFTCMAYKGRYGEGYLVLTPSFKSSRFCNAWYFVKDGSND